MQYCQTVAYCKSGYLRWWYSTQFLGIKQNVWVLNMRMRDSPHISFKEVLGLLCNHA